MNQFRRALAWPPVLILLFLAMCPRAHASTVLPSVSPNCILIGSTCSAADGQLADPGSGVQGVSFWLNGTPSVSLPLTGDVILQIVEQGALSGSLAQGQVLPVSWDFTIATDATSIKWGLEFGLGQGGSINNLGVFDANGTTFSSTGTGSLVVNSTVSGTVYLDATLDVQYTGGTFMSFTVPQQTSFDFNSVPAGAAAVPEPTTFGLAGVGFLLAAWRMARR